MCKDDGYDLRVLSLGAGVQSSTIYLMAIHEEFWPLFSVAIFADTGSEDRRTYEWLEELKRIGGHKIPIVSVRSSNMSIESLAIEYQASGKSPGKGISYGTLPLFTKTTMPDGTVRRGMIRRQCTEKYKIRVIRRKIREMLGAGRRTNIKVGAVEQWIGFSTDERNRCFMSDVQWVDIFYPLIEFEMSRTDCEDWLTDNGYEIPPKSSCVVCPYRTDAEWIRLRGHDPEAFQRAIDLDEAMRHPVGLNADAAYLHQKRVPLKDIEFDETYGNNGCTGICGV